MSDRAGRDWTKTGTICGYAEYLRKQSDAICVLVIRPSDAAFAIDPRCKVADAGELVIESLPDLLIRATEDRKNANVRRLHWDGIPG